LALAFDNLGQPGCCEGSDISDVVVGNAGRTIIKNATDISQETGTPNGLVFLPH
jgi:hypothetical protein